MELARETESHSDQQKHADVIKWLEQIDVSYEPSLKGDEADQESWLKKVGILSPNEILIESVAITQELLANKKAYAEDWVRGGAESFYKIYKIRFQNQEDGSQQQKYIAFKAIVSLGDIETKLLNEVVWMAALSRLNRAGQIFVIGKGILCKEFLIRDSSSIPPKELMEDRVELEKALHSLEISANFDSLETIQTDGILKVIDLGTGDISGPSPKEFIAQFNASDLIKQTVTS